MAKISEIIQIRGNLEKIQIWSVKWHNFPGHFHLIWFQYGIKLFFPFGHFGGTWTPKWGPKGV